MLPHAVQFCILDPTSAGTNFPYIKNIPYKRNTGRDLTATLDEIIEDINRSYLDMNTQRLVNVDPKYPQGADLSLFKSLVSLR